MNTTHAMSDNEKAPKFCLVCDCTTKTRERDNFISFSCGFEMYKADNSQWLHWQGDCNHATDIAVTLRARVRELEAQLEQANARELPCTECLGDGCDACGKTGLYKAQKAIEALNMKVTALEAERDGYKKSYGNYYNAFKECEAERDALRAELEAFHNGKEIDK